jgi:hypothetical protein
VERILIVAGKSAADDTLIRCVNMLFPDCEIRVLSGRQESFEEDETPVSKNDCKAQNA